MKKLEVRLARGPERALVVGTLAEVDRRVYFEYAAEFLEVGFSLSPFRLPFQPGLFEHQDRAFGPLPGLFDDSLPDGWGLLLMDRHFERSGLALAAVSPLDRLAWLGTRTMGCLTYFPPADGADVDASVFDLHDLARESQAILAGEASEVLPQLLRAGGSPGGARPKVLVGYEPSSGRLVSGEDELPPGFEHWLVKLGARGDGPDSGPLEQAYATMARDAGIDVPETRLFETAEGDRFFGTRRFDRLGGRRLHVHSFGNLIHADFRVPSCDYGDLLKVTSILTRRQDQVLRAFRLMAFNVAARNRDDHVKNFAFVLDDETGEWSLSPAYDLTFSPGPGGEHSMTVAGEGRAPGAEHMLRLADAAGLKLKVAKEVLVDVSLAVERWPEHAFRAGVGEGLAGEVRQATGAGRP